MRRTVVVLALLALCLPAAAADKPWPAKGDVVYVPGELSTQVVAFLSFDPKFHTLEPCKPLRVEKNKTKYIRVLDPASSTMSKISYDLCGDWSAVVYRTHDECSAASPVQVIRDGRRCQRIVIPAPPHQTDPGGQGLQSPATVRSGRRGSHSR